jgi:ATP-binding protein involved in chromosome partitioning
MSQATTPIKIGRRDPGRVTIDWADGHRTEYPTAVLRRLCPCAQCIHELTGQPLLDPASVPDDLTQSGVHLVGSYAIAVQFADGHSTGIYTFAALRQNDPGQAPGNG